MERPGSQRVVPGCPSEPLGATQVSVYIRIGSTGRWTVPSSHNPTTGASTKALGALPHLAPVF